MDKSAFWKSDVSLPGRASRPSRDDVRAALECILASREFVGSERLVEFLRYVVEESLKGRAGRIKAYTIAVEGFGRSPDFDPKLDPIVRVMAGRLRRALDRYYASEPGGRARVRISIPRGSYVPNFTTTGQNDPIAGPGEAREPVVAVLPFEHQAAGEHAEILASGIAEELSTELSRFDGLRVIAHYSVRHSPEHPMHPSATASELGADFVISGTVRNGGSEFRVNVHLDQVEGARRVWSRRFDGQLTVDSIFRAQDEVVHNVAATVGGEFGVLPRIVARASSHKAVQQLSAYEAVLRAREYNINLTPEEYRTARGSLEHAIALEPDYALAWALLAQVYFDGAVFGYSSEDDLVERGQHCARRAANLDPSCVCAHYAGCYAALLLRHRDDVIASAKRIVDLNPRDSFMVGAAGWFRAVAGELDAGIELIEDSLALNPHFPSWFHFAPFLRELRDGEYEAALRSAVRLGLPDMFWGPLVRASVLGHLGRVAEARVEYARLLELKPDFPQNQSMYVDSLVLDDSLATKIVDGLSGVGPQAVSLS